MTKKPTKKKPTKTATKKVTKPKALDWAISDQLSTGSRDERAETARLIEGHPMYRKTFKTVITLFRQSFERPTPWTEAEILDTDPNDFDRDPGPFYDYLEAVFGVPQDPQDAYFGGYGGPIRDLIAFLTPRWDGALREY